MKKHRRDDTVTSTREATSTALRDHAPSETLAPEEERALRMRHGVTVPGDAPLPRKGEGHPDAQRALLDMEAELLRRAREASEAPDEDGPAPLDSPTKSKIIRALRKKG